MPKKLVSALATLLTVIVLAGGVGALVVTQIPSENADHSSFNGPQQESDGSPRENVESGREAIDIPDTFDGSATPEANRALFVAVLEDVGAGSGTTATADVLEALGKSGFPLVDTTYTNPATQIEFPADSISIAIALDDICLIGQYSTKWVTSSIQPSLDNGRCLLGDVLAAQPTAG